MKKGESKEGVLEYSEDLKKAAEAEQELGEMLGLLEQARDKQVRVKELLARNIEEDERQGRESVITGELRRALEENERVIAQAEAVVEALKSSVERLRRLDENLNLLLKKAPEGDFN